MLVKFFLPLVATCLFAVPVFALDPPRTVTMTSSQGKVVFDHEGHQAAVNDCTDCHHMGMENDKRACRSCHGVDRLIPRIKNAFHHQCRNCHIKNGGPTACNACHKK